MSERRARRRKTPFDFSARAAIFLTNRFPDSFYFNLFQLIVDRIVNQSSIYCQNCRSANNLRETHCRRCGTRLLLVVFPNSLQYDNNQVPSFYEDHLLERVTLLEVRLAQMSEGLQVAMEIIREQGKIVKEEHALVRALYQVLGILQTEEAEKIRRAWDELRRGAEPPSKEKNQKRPPTEEILARHEAPNAELFAHLLEEGLRLHGEADEKAAFQMFERAVMLSPKNVPLLTFVAAQLFRADRFADAKKHLDKALALAPEDARLILLGAALAAENGEIEKSRALVDRCGENGEADHPCALLRGMLAAAEGDWPESVESFARAAAKRDAPEIQYLLGCAFFEMRDDARALRHLQTTVLLDEKYTDAWFMQAVVLERQNNVAEREAVFETALRHVEPGSQCQEFLRKRLFAPVKALPFQHFGKTEGRLFAGGAARLHRFFKNELEKFSAVAA